MGAAIEGIRVFILAENRLLREALARILSKKTEVRIVGASQFSPQIVDEINQTEPHVLLSDSAAVALSELRLITEVRAALPGVKVVMIGMDPDRDTFLRAIKDGVVGYMLKDASAMEVAAAVRSVANNEAVCPPSLCLALFQHVAAARPAESTFHVNHRLGLTRREQQLVKLISHGLTNKEIAAELSLSEQTVKNHIHRMLRKLGASDRLSAVEVCRVQSAFA